MRIRNINSEFGMSIEFDSVEEMAEAIIDSGLNLPTDGLQEGRDYEVMETSNIKIFIAKNGKHSYQAGFQNEAAMVSFPEAQNYYSQESAVMALKNFADSPEKEKAIENWLDVQ